MTIIFPSEPTIYGSLHPEAKYGSEPIERDLLCDGKTQGQKLVEIKANIKPIRCLQTGSEGRLKRKRNVETSWMSNHDPPVSNEIAPYCETSPLFQGHNMTRLTKGELDGIVIHD